MVDEENVPAVPVWGHVQMTSVLRGGRGGWPISDDRRGRLRDLYTINSDGGGSKIPKIRLTSFIHGPLKSSPGTWFAKHLRQHFRRS